MADKNEKDASGLLPDSRSLLNRTYIDTPEEREAAEKYMTETTDLLETPLRPRQQEVQEGYAGVTKSKEELKRRTELQELIDLAVKGAVKAYAGYQGSRTGLDLSQTSIETPDRSAAYARGLETIRGRQEEVQLKERDLFKDLQTRERRLGEFQSAARQRQMQEDRAKEKADDHAARLKEKQERDAKEEKEAKKLKYTAVMALEKNDLAKITDLAGSAATAAADFVAADLETKELSGRSKIRNSLKKIGATDEEIVQVLDTNNVDHINDLIYKKATNIELVHKARQKILANLSIDGRAATPQEATLLSIYELGVESPTLIPAFSRDLPAGTIELDVFKEGSSTAPLITNQEYNKYLDMREKMIEKSRDATNTAAVKSKAVEQVKKMDAIILIWKTHIYDGKSPEEFKAALQKNKFEVPLVEQPPLIIKGEDRYTLEQELGKIGQEGLLPFMRKIGIGK